MHEIRRLVEVSWDDLVGLRGRALLLIGCRTTNRPVPPMGRRGLEHC
jgi:hypothetical protein